MSKKRHCSVRKEHIFLSPCGPAGKQKLAKTGKYNGIFLNEKSIIISL
jgi:hypothetical protein